MGAPMASWDPDIYALYRRYRERPALDLLTAIPRDLDPREIWDLGCGLGEQAALLAARHPEARVLGMDSSPEMLARAKTLAARVEWVLGDIASFTPEVPADLIISKPGGLTSSEVLAEESTSGIEMRLSRLVGNVGEGGRCGTYLAQ